jgi:hypothetical protein
VTRLSELLNLVPSRLKTTTFVLGFGDSSG